jgi:hypothetical protein
MTVQYVLYENHLTSDPEDYSARVLPSGSADEEIILETMIQRGSTVTRADIVSVLTDYFSTIESLVLDGYNVNTPIANFSISIKGLFSGLGDGYDQARHQISPVVNPGSRLRHTIRNRAQVTKQETLLPKPNPVEYLDVSTTTRNHLLTPGGFGKLGGHRLKFDPGDPAQGVFFLGLDGTPTQVATIGQNKPSELMFLVPALPAGEYGLEVRAAFGKIGLRTGLLDATLTVS